MDRALEFKLKLAIDAFTYCKKKNDNIRSLCSALFGLNLNEYVYTLLVSKENCSILSVLFNCVCWLPSFK